MNILKPRDLYNHFREIGIDEKTTSKFLKLHTSSPQLWKEFEKRCLEQCQIGAFRIFAKAIMEDIRRDSSVYLPGAAFKVSNSWTAYYVRTFCFKYPEHDHRFEKRPVKGLTFKEDQSNEQNLFS